MLWKIISNGFKIISDFYQASQKTLPRDGMQTMNFKIVINFFLFVCVGLGWKKGISERKDLKKNLIIMEDCNSLNYKGGIAAS